MLMLVWEVFYRLNSVINGLTLVFEDGGRLVVDIYSRFKDRFWEDFKLL
jgi:hypothetical protein